MGDEAGSEVRPSYRFGPRDRRGLVVGLRAGQVAPAVAGAVVAFAALRSLGRGAGAVLALVALATGLAAAFVPVGGRTLDEWAPCALGFLAARARSGHRRFLLPPGGSRRPSGPFASLDVVHAGSVGGVPLGAVHDRRQGRLTAAVALPADGFGLLPAAERARRVAAWSGLLAGLAQSGEIERVAWIERTVPDPADHLASHVPGAPPGPARSYEDLLDAERRALYRHELLLACSVTTAVGPGGRGAGARGAQSGPGAPGGDRLAGEVERLVGRCNAAGLAGARPLSPAELSAVVASATRPSGHGDGPWPAPPAASPATDSPTTEGDASGSPWPIGVREEWDCLRTDATWHACFWIAEWPRTAVGDDFLLPLLVGSFLRRTVAVVMAPRPPGRALRITEHARTEKTADLELRRRHGFAVTARLDQERRAVERRVEELAAGHAAYRFSGYVTVTAEDRDALERSCRTVEQAAALAHLELRRLYGSQAEAFCCALPAGRGRP